MIEEMARDKVEDDLDVACPEVPARSVWNLLPGKWIADLEQNQSLALCCRHPENHTIQARYSSAEDKAKGIPDIYWFTCTCGKRHRRFCVGGSHGYEMAYNPEFGRHRIVYDDAGNPVPKYSPRPFWSVR